MYMHICTYICVNMHICTYICAYRHRNRLRENVLVRGRENNWREIENNHARVYAHNSINSTKQVYTVYGQRAAAIIKA